VSRPAPDATGHPMRFLIVFLATLVLPAVHAAVISRQIADPAPGAAAIPAVQSAPACPADAHELLAAFAQLEGLQASFEETKHLALLAVPLKSKGRLYFCAPSYLLRLVDLPEPSTMLIEPGKLRMSNRGGTETIDLRKSDALRLFVTSLLHVFSGDEEALAGNYAMVFEARPAGSGWTLTLTPKTEPLTKMIHELSLSGTGFRVETIVVREPNGDRSVTTLSDIDVERVFTAEEQLELFGIRSD